MQKLGQHRSSCRVDQSQVRQPAGADSRQLMTERCRRSAANCDTRVCIMNVNYSEDELAFRDQVRAFLREKYPADLREKQSKGITLGKDEIVRWQKILYEQGW